MAQDNRKNVKLDPDVKDRFERRRPEGVTQSQFVSKLLDGTSYDIVREATVDDIRDVFRSERSEFVEAFIDALENKRNRY